MIALLALAALLAGPVLVVVPCRRVTRRVRYAGLRKGDRAAMKALVRDGEAWTVVAGFVLAAGALLALMVLAVLG